MANTRLRQRAAGARKGKFHHRFDDGGENLQGELYREGLENPKGVEKEGCGEENLKNLKELLETLEDA